MLHDTHYREGKKVAFKKFNLNIAGLLFLADGFDADKKYPAVVVAHSGGGVKEQCSSLYAWSLAQAGYVTLAFDASHQGESEGLPRYLEDPASRVEDIRSTVDYLMTPAFAGRAGGL
ncbi:MAG: alpha/beta hydrolase [Desulfovibrio sp.]|uniref:alpha/beta hydrolase n=1 Tax=Desulfovibrio sp. TaxID=885 RepID=UPI002588D473|nr:alpha/beta hydrolase [Desulfovibrio sp.]MCD7984499.1 alpha/beta hydrolase [Desulfovibrio sp.]